MSLAIISAEGYVNEAIGWAKGMRDGGFDGWTPPWLAEADRERWETAMATGIDYGDYWREWVLARAIDRAREIISPSDGDGSLILSVVITWGGCAMAMVRHNLDVDADPPIEVARFKDQLTLC